MAKSPKTTTTTAIATTSSPIVSIGSKTYVGGEDPQFGEQSGLYVYADVSSGDNRWSSPLFLEDLPEEATDEEIRAAVLSKYGIVDADGAV